METRHNDFRVPSDRLLGQDLNRRFFLADSIFHVFDLSQKRHNAFYNEISEKAANITFGNYRNLLRLCYARQLDQLRIEVPKVFGTEIVFGNQEVVWH